MSSPARCNGGYLGEAKGAGNRCAVRFDSSLFAVHSRATRRKHGDIGHYPSPRDALRLRADQIAYCASNQLQYAQEERKQLGPVGHFPAQRCQLDSSPQRFGAGTMVSTSASLCGMTTMVVTRAPPFSARPDSTGACPRSRREVSRRAWSNPPRASEEAGFGFDFGRGFRFIANCPSSGAA